MCGPAAVVVAGLVLTAAATGYQTYQQAQQADYQQKILEEEAKAERTAAKLRKEDRQRQLRRAIAEQKVQFGASGTQIDSEILASTAAEYGREQFNDDFNLSRSQYRYEASIENTRTTKSNAPISGVMSFAASAGSMLVSSGALNSGNSATNTGSSGTTGIGLERTERLPGRV